MSEQTCNSCNWTNVSLLKINGKFICHGCIQSELTDLRSRLEKSEAEAAAMREALGDMYSLASQLDDDDPYFGERRDASNRLSIAKKAISTTAGAQLLAELVAARAVVDAVRPLNIYIVNTLVAAYDAIVNQQPKKK